MTGDGIRSRLKPMVTVGSGPVDLIQLKLITLRNMRTEDAIQFIRHKELSITRPSNWADLGCGSGTFTTALAHYLQPGSMIYAVDKEISADLKIPVPAGIQVKTQEIDFVKEELPFEQLDGIVMANALHYVKEQ